MWNPFSDAAEGAVKGVGEAAKSLGEGIAIAAGAFKENPNKALEFEQAVQTALLTFQSSVVSSVNATMQAEAKSEHWMQWAWRPFFGFSGAAVIINNYILLPYLAKVGIVPIVVPQEVWLMLMAVLGVAAWTRGQEKIQSNK